MIKRSGVEVMNARTKMVAEVFKFAMAKIPVFEHVCFAVYDTREPPVLHETFKEVFA